MRGLKAVLLGISLGLMSISAARAADLALPPPAPVYFAPPAFSWAGLYLGGTVGFANAFHTYDDLAGAFLGYPVYRMLKARVLPEAARLDSTCRLEALFTDWRPISAGSATSPPT
jgi:hypothetical protein